jgi:hypothetical protein
MSDEKTMRIVVASYVALAMTTLTALLFGVIAQQNPLHLTAVYIVGGIAAVTVGGLSATAVFCIPAE